MGGWHRMAQITDLDEARRAKKGDAEFVAALARGATITAAADEAGISRSTAYRRLKEPGFAQMLKEAKDEIVDRSLSQVMVGTEEAVETLRGLLEHDSVSVRLAAARSLLNIGAKFMKTAEKTAGEVAHDEDAGGQKVVDLGWGEPVRASK